MPRNSRYLEARVGKIPTDLRIYPATTGTRWMDDAACMDAEELSDWVPGDMKTAITPGGRKRAHEMAEQYCAECPVRKTCLRFGLETRSEGIFGGEMLRSYPGRSKRTPLL